MADTKTSLFPDQIVPLTLTVVACAVLAGILYIEINVLNMFVIARETIKLHIYWSDVLVGMTIYLKTSIDFAIFIGRLMGKYPGWKNRVMIEIGTALGNACGTLAILVLWDVFREVRFLMAGMIIIAALVLFRLAEEGLEHVTTSFGGSVALFARGLRLINQSVAPVLDKLVPSLSIKDEGKKSYWGLFVLAFTIPFILGLDDFAGYIPLFNIVNVFGFALGVFAGHMVLNIFLFLSPSKTIETVKNPVVSYIGSIAFVGLALWGLFEAAKLIGFLAP